jgi:hypothetical protein
MRANISRHLIIAAACVLLLPLAASAEGEVIARCQLEHRCTSGSSESGSSCTPGFEVVARRNGRGDIELSTEVIGFRGRTIVEPATQEMYDRDGARVLSFRGEQVQFDVLVPSRGRSTGQVTLDVFEVDRQDSHLLGCRVR